MSTPPTAGRRPLVYGAISLSVLFVVWLLATTLFQWIEPRVLPSPGEVVAKFAEFIREPFSGLTLGGHMLSSLNRWFWGVLFAMLIGIPVGVMFAWAPWFRTIVNPIFELLHFIPPFAYIPLAVLWFGASTATQAMVVFVAAFPAFVINSQLGVSQVDPIYTQAARVFGAGQFTTLRRVVLPAAAPSIYTGLRIAISNGWMALVGAELVVGKVGSRLHDLAGSGERLGVDDFRRPHLDRLPRGSDRHTGAALGAVRASVAKGREDERWMTSAR